MKKCALMNFLLSVLMIVSLVIVPVCVYADGDNSLTVRYVADNNTIISGAVFKLYRALNMDGTLAGEFANYDIEIGNLKDSEAMGVLSDTLAAYAVRDNLPMTAVGVTDAKGRCTFDGLENGVYLVVGVLTRIDDMIYTCMPCLISLPYETEDALLPDVVINAKYAVRSSASGSLEYSVKKVWKDDYETGRPADVVVELLQDGKIYDTVTLNAKNNWTHTWKNLVVDSEWLVTEKNIPEGYRVSITQNGTMYIVTNTFKGDDSSVTDTNQPTTETTDTNIYESSATTTAMPPSSTDFNGSTIPPSSTDYNGSTIPPSSTGYDGSTMPPSTTATGDPTEPGMTTHMDPSSTSQTTSKYPTSTTTTVSPPGSGSPGAPGGSTPTLPQTGQLWWPVPLLLIAGILVLLSGIVELNLDYEEKS